MKLQEDGVVGIGEDQQPSEFVFNFLRFAGPAHLSIQFRTPPLHTHPGENVSEPDVHSCFLTRGGLDYLNGSVRVALRLECEVKRPRVAENRSSLRRQADAVHKGLEARVGTQRIKSRVRLETQY